MGSNKYTFHFKKDALLKLLDNEFDFRKTARQLKISQSILRIWNKEYGGTVFGKETDVKLLAEKQADILYHNTAGIRSKTEGVYSKILDEFERRLKTPEAIETKDLINMAKETAPYVLPKLSYKEGEKEGEGKNLYNNDLQLIYSFANRIRKNSNLGTDETINQTSIEVNSKKRSPRSK